MITVPETLASEMDSWECHARSLVSAWFAVGKQAGASPVSNPREWDGRAFRAVAAAPVNIEYDVDDSAGCYVGAIAPHFLSIAALFEIRQVALSVWPLVRAELEIAGRVGWLLDPGTATEAVPAGARVARFSMKLLAASCRERFTASMLRNKSRERTAVSGCDRQRDVLAQVFPESHTEWRRSGRETEWYVGGEEYLGLGPGAAKFVQAHFSGVPGLYDLFSDYSHPSRIRFSAQASRPDDVSGITVLSCELDRELLGWQMKMGCLILYRAAHLVARYFALDDSPLELSASAVPSDWFHDGRSQQ
ncbi:MAG: hypothetical protein E6R06_01170 [Mycobacterium sp.]|nr:MAG: hypothetical protein E6R06_01170 [Mycobacterium sp.]